MQSGSTGDGDRTGGEDRPSRDGGSERRSSGPLPGGRLPEGYGRYAGLGIQYAATILVLGALGFWADRSFGTTPWLMIAGIVLGSVGGFVSLVRQVPPGRSKPS